MIRILSAAALAALLSAPALAQTQSPEATPGGGQMDQPGITGQSSPSSPGMTDQSGQSPGLSEDLRQSPQTGQTPLDCLPNDPRPECQTAQLPGEDERLDVSPPEAQQGAVPGAEPQGQSPLEREQTDIPPASPGDSR